MTSLVPSGASGLSPAQRREWQEHLEQIERIGSLTVQVAGQTNQTIKLVTREAMSELRAINAEIERSTLPAAQRQQLRAQVAAALMRHEQLLAIATRESQQRLIEATKQPAERSGLAGLSDDIDDALHALSGGIFRRK